MNKEDRQKVAQFLVGIGCGLVGIAYLHSWVAMFGLMSLSIGICEYLRD